MSEGVLFSRLLEGLTGGSVFKNVREKIENYCHVSLFPKGNKVFKKLVNNRIVEHQEKCDLFFSF